MIRPAPDLGRVPRLFEPSSGGVVGLVDALLGFCRDEPLRLDYQVGACRIRPLDAADRKGIDVPLPKAVFRAVLARVAALCNEHVPGSVTPYRGRGELTLATEPPVLLHAAFTNTPAEQWLELRAV